MGSSVALMFSTLSKFYEKKKIKKFSLCAPFFFLRKKWVISVIYIWTSIYKSLSSTSVEYIVNRIYLSEDLIEISVVLHVITFDTRATIRATRQMSDKTKQRKVLRGLALCRMMSAFVWGFDPIFRWWRGVSVVIFASVGTWIPTDVSQNCNLPLKNLYPSISK